MTQLRYATSIASFLKGTEAMIVLAPQNVLRAKRHPAVDALPKELAKLTRDLASDTAAGLNGSAAGTLTGSSPRKLAVGVLPNTVSRHNSPSRTESIRAQMAASSTGRRGKAGAIVILDDPAHLAGALSGIARALPVYSAKTAKKSPASLQLLALDAKGKVVKISKAVRAHLEAMREAGRLVDTPPTEMNPAEMQKEAYAMVRGLANVTKKSIVGPKLLEAGCGGIHAVGRTALSPPRLVILTYSPKGAKKHIALVGKGVTYDTGGLSIKVGGGMVNMKSDMGGSAAVLGAFRSLAEGGCKHKVSALLCLAENAIGPDAFKNDDILHMHSGKTVEINNTDAEGRLVLGDGVSYAARKLKADVVIDAATLTGAQLVATGRQVAAVVTDDEKLEAILTTAGRQIGDLCHPLVYNPEFHRKEFASKVADMRNSVSDRMNAQSSCAGAFVHWHLDGTRVRWAHVDLAGPAFVAGRATGFGVGLLAEAVRAI